MNKNYKYTCMILAAAVLLMLLPSQAFAKARGVLPGPEAGHSFVNDQLTVMMFDGPCFYLAPQDKEWHPVARGMTINSGDSVRTGSTGYMILAWTDKDMIAVKPNTGIRIGLSPAEMPQVNVGLHRGEVMLVSRNSGQVSVNGKHGALALSHGEAVYISVSSGDTIKAVHGRASFSGKSSQQTIEIPEGYMLDITPDAVEHPIAAFDPDSEYDSFRRFANWLDKFKEVHDKTNLNVNYKVLYAKINGQFLNSLTMQDNGYYCIEGENGAIPKQIHLQIKLEPYPAPEDRIELNLGKDLSYAFREGRDGYHEVLFTPPSIPDFLVRIHSVDFAERRNRIFQAGFSIQNKRALTQNAKDFCQQLSDAFSRRDHLWFRKNVSRDYKDWQGNTSFDFVKMSEDTMRTYRDIRLTLHPFNYDFRENKILIHLNYRLSALTGTWNWRFEDRGSEILTIIREDGIWKLYSKTSGMFFNRLKVAVDLKKGVVKGRILDERTKRPISGVLVTLIGTGYKATSDSMGEYAIYNVVTGTYNVKFTKNGYGEITASKITVRPSGEQF